MDLIEKVSADLLTAMKARDEQLLSPLRMLKTEFQRAQANKGAKSPLTGEETLAIVQRLVKQRREAAEQYRLGNAMDRAEQELAEAAVLERYMPAQLSDDELLQIVREAISKTGAQSPKDMGKVMGPVMAEAKGRADGQRVRQCVETQLKSL